MLINKTTKNCEFCGHEFAAIRPTAKFCCNSCRTKANVLRRENEKIETQKAIEQAEHDEKKRLAPEARKLKIAEKTAAVAEMQRLKDQELQIQKEKIASELAEKQRIEDEALEQQQRKADADKRQRLEEEERKKKADKELHDRKLKAAEEIGKAFGEWLANRSKNANNSDSGTQKCQIEPVIKIPPTNHLKPGDPSMHYNLNSTNQGLNSSGFRMLNAMNKPFISNTTRLPPQSRQNIPSTPVTNPIAKVIDDILDKIHIF